MMELSRKKQKTNSIILENTIDLLVEKTIKNVTIKDISMKVNMGEATIYRNFSTKENLILQAAIKLSKRLEQNYFIVDKKDNGFEQLKAFYDSFVLIFKDHQEYYRFLGELDYYIIERGNVDISEYENTINVYYDKYLQIYRKGLADGSIKAVPDINSVYYSTVVALESFAKKLAAENIVTKDYEMDKIKQLETLVEITLNYFRR